MISYCVDDLRHNSRWWYSSPEAVFDEVERIAGEAEAIEASSWAELAAVGDTYIGTDFEIEVVE